MEALKLLIWFIAIAVNIYLDRKGAKRNYIQVFIIRGMAAIAHGMLFSLEGWHTWQWKEVISNDWWPILAFQVSSFWVFFELGLNLVRGKHPLYYDTKERDSGWIDKFFAWAGPLPHLIAKLIAVAVMVWAFLKVV